MAETDDRGRKPSIDWAPLQAEYMTSDLSYAQAAEKWGIPLSTVRSRAKRYKWATERERLRQESALSAVRVIAEEVRQDYEQGYASAIDKALIATDFIIDSVVQAAEDPRHFFKSMVETTVPVVLANGRLGRETTYVMQDTGILNARALKEAAQGLSAATHLKRLLSDVLDAVDRESLALRRDALALETRKVGMGDDIESESGIALMPPVDDSLLADAIDDTESLEPEG